MEIFVNKWKAFFNELFDLDGLVWCSGDTMHISFGFFSVLWELVTGTLCGIYVSPADRIDLFLFNITEDYEKMFIYVDTHERIHRAIRKVGIGTEMEKEEEIIREMMGG